MKLFNHLPESVVVQLTNALRTEIYMSGDKIVKAGTRGESLYFITSGTVAVYTATGKEVTLLEIVLPINFSVVAVNLLLLKGLSLGGRKLLRGDRFGNGNRVEDSYRDRGGD